MEGIRHDNAEPVPQRDSPHRMGTIMIRFIGLLLIATVALVLAWNR